MTFLAAIAQANHGKLATLDRPFARLFPETVKLIEA